MRTADKVIFGAGIYGLYAALESAKNGEEVVVLEYDQAAFGRATFINQARVHNGYHYPRSFATAIQSKMYYNRFKEDYAFCINDKFDKIYATANRYSWTEGKQFKSFCDAADIKCEDIEVTDYFLENTYESAFLTEECSYDAMQLKTYFIDEIQKWKNCEIIFGSRTKSIEQQDDHYIIKLASGLELKTGFVLNATYASVNQIIQNLGFDGFNIKYELCEMILCEVSDNLKNVGLTMMDGPFFSLMPFGNTGLHSLSAVSYTPHKSSFGVLPKFDCQSEAVQCSPAQLNNCNLCPNQPETYWNHMKNLAYQYLNEDIEMKYHKSIFSIKPILKASEMDDSRPTLIKEHSAKPYFYTVLSGKINTIYDLDVILKR